MKSPTHSPLKSLLKITVIGGISLFFCTQVTAEIVALPSANNYSVNNKNITIPVTSTTTEKVQQTYGTPLSKHGPIGNPAIYYWEYEQFTVYFEDNRVIHTVVK